MEFLDLGGGARIVEEVAPIGSEMALDVNDGWGLADIYRHLQPNGEVPQALLDFDRAYPSAVASSRAIEKGSRRGLELVCPRRTAS